MNRQLQYSTKTGFETLVRHKMDQLTAGRYADPLDVAVAADDVAQAMLRIIKRRGLLPELLTELGLCSLCQGRYGWNRGGPNG